ncbi:MAG: class I SAM-dependent methyltransferase [Bryobacterales bacterium]|nr:class I SAM-dependent methyltransferase [Bryobacterales bacterium]
MRLPENDPKSVILRNRLAYGRIAAEWERRQEMDYDHGFHEQCRALFLSHLKGIRVLDAGCGLGLDSLAFAAAGLQVAASDIAEEFLPLIRRKQPRIGLAAMDLTAPCFRAGCFDGIFACASFLHVPHELVEQTLSGFVRMLASGGILFLHHVESSRGLSEYRIDELLIPDNPAVCFCHTEQQLSALLASAGLHVLAVGRLKPSKYPSPCADRNSLVPYQMIACKPVS